MYEQIHKTKSMRLKKKIFQFMEGGYMQPFMAFILIVSLFLPDAWGLGNAPSNSDPAKWAIMLAVFIVFILETVTLSLVQPDYFLGFFFWLDLLGTVSMVLDIGWIANSFMPSNNDASSKGSLLRAARAAKLGARFGRLMRLLKFMKYIEMIPCLKKNADVAEPSLSSLRKVSNELSSVISRRVAFLVLLIVIIVPFLNYDTSDYSAEAWLDTFIMIGSHNSSENDSRFQSAVSELINFYKDKEYKVLTIRSLSPYLNNGFEFVKSYSVGHNVRDENNIFYTGNYFSSSSPLFASPSCPKKDCSVKLFIDTTIPGLWDSFYGIMLMVLVIFVLFSFVISFNSVVEKLLVLPLEKMMSMLRASATVMLKSMKVIEEEKEEFADNDSEEDGDGDLETLLLEKMIEKLSRIMKHALPTSGADVVVTEGNNIDTATATWLNQGFSTKNTSTLELANKAIKQGAVRIKHIHSDFVDPDKINSWEFDVLSYSHEQLFEIMQYLFEAFELFAEFSVSTIVFGEFVQEISKKYIENTYHNFRHGCDVAHTVYRLIVLPRLHNIFSPLELLSLMTAALAHDVGHPGVNNVYLVKAKHKLALRHNDKSPLENMHCSLLYDILSKAATNIFATLTETQWRESRKLVIAAILGTDMIHHFEQINKVQVFLEVNGEDIKEYCAHRSEQIVCLKEADNRLFVLELILHSADISNPYKPFVICEKWADLVVQEFCAQGDKEKKEGLEISPMMDRDAINLYNMQMGFIEFVVTPLICGVINLFPPLHEMGSNIENNMNQWGELRKAEILKDEKIADKNEECRKMDERLSKFRDKMAFVAKLRALDEASKPASSGDEAEQSKQPQRRKSISVLQVMASN